MKTFFIIEASHLFRAGDKFKTQFFVLDVVHFLQRKFFPGEAHTLVFHGSVKETQAIKYAAALERHDVKVIRMRPIKSLIGSDRVYYKPTYYLHQLMGEEIPKSSRLVFVGFHNVRYLKFLEKYAADYKFALAAFATPSKKQGVMGIPVAFAPFLEQSISLDAYVQDIKAEFHKKK